MDAGVILITILALLVVTLGLGIWVGLALYAVAITGLALFRNMPVEKLLAQLAPGGRMIIPVGPSGCQDLKQVTRKDDHFEEVSLGAVSFVPLVHGK